MLGGGIKYSAEGGEGGIVVIVGSEAVGRTGQCGVEGGIDSFISLNLFLY